MRIQFSSVTFPYWRHLTFPIDNDSRETNRRMDIITQSVSSYCVPSPTTARAVKSMWLLWGRYTANMGNTTNDLHLFFFFFRKSHIWTSLILCWISRTYTKIAICDTVRSLTSFFFLLSWHYTQTNKAYKENVWNGNFNNVFWYTNYLLKLYLNNY